MENWPQEIKDAFKASSVPREYLGSMITQPGGYYITANGGRYVTLDGKYYYSKDQARLLFNGENIVAGSMKITQSISDAEQLVYGSAEPSMVEFQLAGESFEPVYYLTPDGSPYVSATGEKYVLTNRSLFGNITGYEIVLEQEIYGDRIPMGVYVVASCVKESDTWFRNVVAYDRLILCEQNVADWYNAIEFTAAYPTLKQFRESLCDYLGLRYEDAMLPNDSIIIEKTVNPAELPGKDVLQSCCELNACWPQMTPTGILRWITLEAESAETFAYDEYDQVYRVESTREDYICAAYNSVVVRETEGDIGGHYPKTLQDNPYVIQGNFLVFGKSTEQLTAIAQSMLSVIGNKPYKPHSTIVQGRPYLQCGDMITVRTKEETYSSYILKRTLAGESAMVDTYTAKGQETAAQTYGISRQVMQLKSKTNELTRTVDGTVSRVSDLEVGVSAIEQYVDSITLSVVNGSTSSSIRLMAGSIVHSSQTIQMTGLVSFTNLSAPGQTTINGGNITTGTVAAARIDVNNLYVKHLSGADGSFSGELVAASGTFEGDLTANTCFFTNLQTSSGNIRLGNIRITPSSLDNIAGGSFTIGAASLTLAAQSSISISASNGVSISMSPSSGDSVVRTSGGILALSGSSLRYKQHIKELQQGFSKAIIRAMKIYEFEYKNSPDERDVGILAEDMTAIDDRFVGYLRLGNGLKIPDTVRDSRLVYVALDALKLIFNKLDELEDVIDGIKKAI